MGRKGPEWDAEWESREDLAEVAGSGNLVGVTAMLYWHSESEKKEFIEKMDFRGNNALHYSCKAGHSEVVKYLLAHGASVEARNRKGETALHQACGNGHIEGMAHAIVL